MSSHTLSFTSVTSSNSIGHKTASKTQKRKQIMSEIRKRDRIKSRDDQRGMKAISNKLEGETLSRQCQRHLSYSRIFFLQTIRSAEIP